jgi:hypothetical protein
MTAPIRSMPDRNERERKRLREKRADAAYLAQQRINRAAQMRATRAERKRKGCCRECDKRALKGMAYCHEHLIYERNRDTK